MRTGHDGSPDPHLRTPEFDAFGPWVLPVQTADEVPPLFRAHLTDPTGAAVVIKVPRAIDRRDADATMNLYDHLLAVDDTGLTVLSRAPGSPGGFTTRVLSIDRLLAIEESVDLLDARLTVHAVGSPAVTVPYNGSSRDTVDVLVRAVRQRWLSPDPVTPGRPSVPPGLRDLDEDLALVALYREVLAQDSGFVLLGAHSRRVVRPAGSGTGPAVARVVHAVWPMTLQAAIVCGDDAEIQILHRRHWWVRGGRPVNSFARTMLPRDRVRTVAAADHPVYVGVRVVTLGLEGVELTIPVPAGSTSEQALLAVRP